MKTLIKCLALGFVFAVAIAFIACGSSTSTTPNVVSTTSQATPSKAVDDLALGRDLYKQNCASCHRDAGLGGKITVDGKEINPKDLTSERMKGRSDEKLLRDIVEGAPDDGMPAFKDKLTEPQIKETVRFIRAELQKQPNPEQK